MNKSCVKWMCLSGLFALALSDQQQTAEVYGTVSDGGGGRIAGGIK